MIISKSASSCQCYSASQVERYSSFNVAAETVTIIWHNVAEDLEEALDMDRTWIMEKWATPLHDLKTAWALYAGHSGQGDSRCRRCTSHPVS